MKAIVLGARDGSNNLGDNVAYRLAAAGWDVTTDDCCRERADTRNAVAPYFDPPPFAELVEYDGCVVTLGSTVIEHFTDIEEIDLVDLLRSNLEVPLKAAHRYVRARTEINKGGRLVLTGSYGHNHVLSNSVAYCAAKAGLDMAVRAIAWDLRELPDWVVSIVHPYHIADSPMTQYVEKRVMDTKGLSPLEARAYSRKDLGMWPDLLGEDVAVVIKNILDGRDGFKWSRSFELSGPVR